MELLHWGAYCFKDFFLEAYESEWDPRKGGFSVSFI